MHNVVETIDVARHLRDGQSMSVNHIGIILIIFMDKCI